VRGALRVPNLKLEEIDAEGARLEGSSQITTRNFEEDGMNQPLSSDDSSRFKNA
jgi:hypothetical protein